MFSLYLQQTWFHPKCHLQPYCNHMIVIVLNVLKSHLYFKVWYTCATRFAESEDFDIFIGAANSNKFDKDQAYKLLNIAGKEAIERARSCKYKAAVLNEHGTAVTSAETKEDITVVLKIKFRKLCQLQKNITMDRYTFNSRNQSPTESIESYSWSQDFGLDVSWYTIGSFLVFVTIRYAKHCSMVAWVKPNQSKWSLQNSWANTVIVCQCTSSGLYLPSLRIMVPIWYLTC